MAVKLKTVCPVLFGNFFNKAKNNGAEMIHGLETAYTVGIPSQKNMVAVIITSLVTGPMDIISGTMRKTALPVLILLR